jgi:hypothetical protein
VVRHTPSTHRSLVSVTGSGGGRERTVAEAGGLAHQDAVIASIPSEPNARESSAVTTIVNQQQPYRLESIETKAVSSVQWQIFLG